jgi:hypothetical protein
MSKKEKKIMSLQFAREIQKGKVWSLSGILILSKEEPMTSELCIGSWYIFHESV